MNGYNFTQAVRRALGRAREEAARLNHEYVGTEHVLLGLLIDRPSIALEMLDRCAVSFGDVRNRIEGVIQTGKGESRGPDLPYTSRAKKVLELSMEEARELNSNEVNTGHLLLGLVRERDGVAAQVLVEMGVTLSA